MDATSKSLYDELILESNDQSRTVDLTAGALIFEYFEDIFSPVVTAKLKVNNTAESIEKDGVMQSIYNGLPLRGGERLSLRIKANTSSNKDLDFASRIEDYFYVSSISNVEKTQDAESFTLQLVSREAITNETSRISKKYASVELNKQLPKAFDVSNRGKCFWLSFYPELYKLTRFSLIAETQMHNNACRYSEKTVKAILNKHPFIICGYYKTLELLRDDGFRTFEGFIDESYDNILDWRERQAAIADEVSKLVNMSNDAWLLFQRDIQPIINHNFNRLVELSSVKGLELSHVINTIYDMS